MKISYIDTADGKIRIYNSEGFLTKELDGMGGRACGHGNDFVLVEFDDCYKTLTCDGDVLATFKKHDCRLSSVCDDNIIMCEDGHFVHYDRYGKKSKHVAMRKAMKNTESRHKWAHYGEVFITMLIVFNALAAGAMTYLADDSALERWLNIFCDVSIVIFVIEILLRIFCGKSPKDFFQGEDSGWNWFDLIVTVVSSLSFFTGIEGIVGARAIRILRELRLLRVVSGSSNMKRIFHALIYALPQMSWASLFFVLLYYIYGIIGVELFGAFSENFESLHRTFLTLLQLMSFDDWTAITTDLMEHTPLAWIYIVSFLILAAYILANLLVGIVVDSLNEVREKEEIEHSDIEREFSKLEEQLESVKRLLKKSAEEEASKNSTSD
ncbi:MAG: ion transporter [Bacteroidales bacterium]|nr:ion transporter [Bacteroidales bacterium]